MSKTIVEIHKKSIEMEMSMEFTGIQEMTEMVFGNTSNYLLSLNNFDKLNKSVRTKKHAY